MAGADGRGRSSSDVDHYTVLGLPTGEEGSKLSLKEIEKAYRNQSRICHPDKRPDDPNATADFQLLTSSFEVLRDEMKRSCFDAKLRSRRERALRDSFQDAKRRKMAADLDERERSAAAAVDPAEEVRRKEKMKADELKREIAEFKARRAKKASESVRAIQSVSGDITNPLLVLLLEPIALSFSITSSTNQNESVGPEFNNVVGAGFQDYEALVMKKLQQANEKKKCMP